MVDPQCLIDGEYLSITIDGNDMYCSTNRLEVHLNDRSHHLRPELEDIGAGCMISSSAPYCTSFVFFFSDTVQRKQITRQVLSILENDKKPPTYK